MRKVFTGGASTAAVLAFSLAAFAQAGQTGAQTPQPTMKNDQPQITLVGCVQRESDYRASRGAGSGGAAGTGVGAGNEFVLVNATVSPTGAMTGAGSATGAQAGTTGTSGSTAMGEAYELTGSGEGELESFVGRRVEITGHLKAGSDAKASGATGTGTGTGTGGTNILGQDLNLKEFEVVSAKAAEGTCPTMTPKK